MITEQVSLCVALHQTCDMLIFQVTEKQQHHLEQRFHLPIYESYAYFLNAPEKMKTKIKHRKNKSSNY